MSTNSSLTFPIHNVNVRSSGPCVVCDGTSVHDQQVDSSTVHPSCLSRITSTTLPSSSNDTVINHEDMSSSCSSISSSSPVTNMPDGGQLWLCRNCNQLQSPLNFPAINDENDSHSYTYSNQNPICYDCSIDGLDFDFGSLATSDASGSTFYDCDAGRNSSTDSNILRAFPQPTTEVWTCTYCQRPNRLQEFSSCIGLDGSGMADAVICNDCVINFSLNSDGGPDQFPGWDAAGAYEMGFIGFSTGYEDDSEDANCHGVPVADAGSLANNNASNYNEAHPQAGPSSSRAGGNTNITAPASATVGNTQRTKRKQTRRPKTGTKPPATGDTASSNSNEPYTEPVIQWISRRDPLPPNICSRCRCRHVRPGKKQCQHCAYDYRGTRDHRASMGLCITCAEPLEKDVDYAPASGSSSTAPAGENATAGSENGTTSTGTGATKPRRSCKACREKNRLKKAADKAARLRMMAAEGAGGMDHGVVSNGPMVGDGESFVYRTS